MIALIALPIAAFVLLSALARRLLHRGGLPADWPAGLVVGGLLLCGFVAMATELLSLAVLLRSWVVVGVWIGLVGVLAVLLKRWPKEDIASIEPVLPKSFREASTAGFWVWLIVGVLLVFTLVVALCAPPNQHDALGYHLPRQIRWIDMGRVAHYPVGDLREIQFPPLAEYIQMHTMLLTGGDVFVHAPSWLAYMLAVLASALACRALGAPRAAPLAALLVATQPSLFMLSVTPKNDPLLVFAIVTLGWLAIECLNRQRCGLITVSLIGLALGVGALTKTSAIVLMFPLCVLIGVYLLCRHRVGAIWRGTVIAGIAATMMLGHTARNFETFGMPLGPLTRADGGFGLSMERHDPAALASNVVRHLASHVPVVDSHQAAVVEDAVRRLHTSMGWNPDEPMTTWLGSFSISQNVGTTGIVPEPALLVLLAVFPVAMLLRRLTNRPPAPRWWPILALWGCAFAALALYMFTIKWQVWQPRLHAPALALGAAPIAVALWPSKRPSVAWVPFALIVVPSSTFVVWAGIPHSTWPHQGVWAALSHPRHPSLRWHPPRAMEFAEKQLAVLEQIRPRKLAIVCWNMQYNVMREAARLVPDVGFTSLSDELGNSPHSLPERWEAPDAYVTEWRPMIYTFGGQQLFHRVGEPGCLNVFVPADTIPQRSYGEAMMGPKQFQAFEFLSGAAPERMGAQFGMNTAAGLAMPGGGVDLQLPDDRVPRTLLISLNPLRRQDAEIIILLDDEELERVALPPCQYTNIEVAFTLRRPGQTLRLRFPGAEGLKTAASIAWAQLPKRGHLKWYDQTQVGTPFRPARGRTDDPEPIQ